MTGTTTYRIPIEELSAAVLDIRSVNTRWNNDDNFPEDGESWQYWESFNFELESGRDVTLISNSGRVVAGFIDGGLRIGFDGGEVDVDSIECLECEGTGSAGDEDDPDVDECKDCAGTGNQAKLTEDDIQALNDIDGPEYHGSEGPMMNYRYPVEGADSDDVGTYRHRMDAIEAAYVLRGVPLCVVEYDDGIALALTGGGMDLSYEICEAFTLLGYYPPTAFCDLPHMAGMERNESYDYVTSAIRAGLGVAAQRAQLQLARFNEKFPAS